LYTSIDPINAGITIFIIHTRLAAENIPTALSLKYPMKNIDTEPRIPISASVKLGINEIKKYDIAIPRYAVNTLILTLNKKSSSMNWVE